MGKKRSWDVTRRTELGKGDASSSGSDSESDEEAALEAAAVKRARMAAGGEGEGERAVAKRGTYNRAGLLKRLADISDNLGWVETLDQVGAPLAVEDPEDDLLREVAFFNLAKDAVMSASARLRELGEPYKRPEDYFAEMVKSDKHMGRIKDQLIFEQRKIAAFEMRKQQQHHKKRAKQVEQEKAKQRSDDKKSTLEAVKKWRKSAASRGGQLDDDDGFEQVLYAKAAPTRTSKKDLPQKGKKRLARDSKFGFGGKKRFAKRNDADSYGKDTFNAGAMRAGKTIMKKGKKGARPGKARRAQMRGK
eukprot:g2633.t1